MGSWAKMDPELKTKWVKALRSGRYKQTQQQLKSIEGGKPYYCCLGVLCTVSREGKWNDHADGFYLCDVPRYELKDGSGVEFDLKLKDTLRNKPKVLFGLNVATNNKLVKMNDDGASFQAISDWIETHL